MLCGCFDRSIFAVKCQTLPISMMQKIEALKNVLLYSIHVSIMVLTFIHAHAQFIIHTGKL